MDRDVVEEVFDDMFAGDLIGLGLESGDDAMSEHVQADALDVLGVT